MWPFKTVEPLEQKMSGETDRVLRELLNLATAGSGFSVTPENCMQSPTVHAIVTAVSRRMSVSAIRVMRKTTSNGRDIKEHLPSHPVAKLLGRPNDWQTRVNFWTDATSSLLRYGSFTSYKSRGLTGPILSLIPMHAAHVEVMQDPDTLRVQYRYNGRQIYAPRQVFHARMGSRDFLTADSPINDVRESIGLEIAAERFGAAFFGNGAMPLVYFKLMEGFKDFRTNEEREEFLRNFKEKFGGRRTFSAMMLPKGMDLDSVKVENDKAQFIETRRFIRSVIAGAFGVPPHLVGDLERATFNNVEQQDQDFVINVVLPIAQIFESAMERDLLTDEDRASGIIIRFNLDSIQRADFKSRQEGFRIQRDAGVISPNDWREMENMNPISDEDGGDDYVRPANFVVAGEEPAEVMPNEAPDRPV